MPDWKEIINEEKRKAAEQALELERLKNSPKEAPLKPNNQPDNPTVLWRKKLEQETPVVMEKLKVRNFLLAIQSDLWPRTKLLQGAFGYMLESIDTKWGSEREYKGSVEQDSYREWDESFEYKIILSVALKLHNSSGDDLENHTRSIYTPSSGRGTSSTIKTYPISVSPCINTAVLPVLFPVKKDFIYPADDLFHNTKLYDLKHQRRSWQEIYFPCIPISDFNQLPDEAINALFRKIIQEVQKEDFIPKTKSISPSAALMTPKQPWYKKLW